MRKRTKVSLAVALLIICAIAFQLAGTLAREAQLRSTCQTADRVIVNLNVYPKPTSARSSRPSFPSFEVKGAQEVAELLDAIDLELGWIPWDCRCFGDMLFEFYRGQTLLATLSYHHGENIAWRKGSWSGNAELTGTGIAALRRWLQTNGCPTSDEAQAIARRAWEAMDSVETATPTTQNDGD